jgi:hypothetical protein
VPRRKRGGRGEKPIDETTQQQWEQIARSPVQWLISAENLKACAEFLGQRFVDYFSRRLPPGASESTEGAPASVFGPIFQMLAGYSIEALVKGICVAREPGLVVGGKLPEWFTKHDLEGLLRRAKIQLAGGDQKFLRRLHVSVMWSGRYPVSKTAGETLKFSSTGDLASFLALYDKLVIALQKEMAARHGAEGS